MARDEALIPHLMKVAEDEFCHLWPHMRKFQELALAHGPHIVPMLREHTGGYVHCMTGEAPLFCERS